MFTRLGFLLTMVPVFAVLLAECDAPSGPTLSHANVAAPAINADS